MMIKPKQILNIGAGKIEIDLKTPIDDFIINIDRCYELTSEQKDMIERHNAHMSDYSCGGHMLCNVDIFQFLDSYPLQFDRIVANRIFEHMEYVGDSSIGRLLEACNKILKVDGELHIIVPNAIKLAKLLLYREQSPISMYWIKDVLIVNTEFTNSSHVDPHCSVWTPRLARFYIDSEGTWEVINIDPDVCFAGRDIYMKIIVKKRKYEIRNIN